MGNYQPGSNNVKLSITPVLESHTPGVRGVIGLTLLLGACATPPPTPSTQHLDPPPPVVGKVPDFAAAPVIPKPPKPSAKPELYSVVVHNIEVQDLLFALARDAKINVDIHPGISGTISMNAVDQTLTEIMDRIVKQADIRYELNGKNLLISPDSPFLKLYRVDYPNISRDAKSSISTSVTVASAGAGGDSGGSGSNSSDTTITNTTNNRFWETLTKNLQDLLHETDKVFPEGSSETVTEQKANQASTPGGGNAISGAIAGALGGAIAGALGGGASAATSTGKSSTTSTSTSKSSSGSTGGNANQEASTVVKKSTFREAASVIANPENGIINVRATQRQHEKVREFLDRIMGNARRQVLIEATIVEVGLSDRYQQGIDWSMLRTTGSLANSGLTLGATGQTAEMLTGGVIVNPTRIVFNRAAGNGAYTIASALRLLESFGTLRVLSSPKVSVLNNQTSILKVVDNFPYFSITVTPGTAATATSAATAATYSSTLETVPIGFLMTVIPQISDSGEVILNLRPTISRITSFVNDPNPELTRAGVTNRIPVVQTREMESIMRVQDGDTAILGGLIQDTRDGKTDGIPGLSDTPGLGNLFTFRDNRSSKTELVIFLRPTVLTDASINGDFRAFRSTIAEQRKAFSSTEREHWPAPAQP